MSFPSASLGDLCGIVIGRTPSRSQRAYWGEGHPWLSISDLVELNVWSTREQITSAAVEDCRCRLVQPGTVLLSFKLSIGKVGIARVPLFTNEAIAALPVLDKGKLDPGFLSWALRSIDLTAGLDRAAKGLTLSKDKLEQIQIPLPTLQEQRRIAAILDKADALRTKRREAMAQLDRLAQSIFVEMFGDPVSGMFRWPVKPLSECCQAINDCPHSTPTWKDTGYVCLRTSNLTEGDWNWDDRRFVAEDEYHERSKRGYIEPGDIVLSREGTVGVAAIVRPGMEVCMGQRLVQVRCAPSSILPEYLLHHLLHVLQPSRISRLMVGSTAQHLNVKELRALPTPLPPVALQQQFAMRIQRIKTLYPQHEESIAESNALFSSLGQLFFRRGH